MQLFLADNDFLHHFVVIVETVGRFQATILFAASKAFLNVYPIGPGRLRGPNDQTHSCLSETSYSMMPKLCDFYFLSSRHVLTNL